MKAEKSRARRLGYLSPLFLGTGLFLCYQFYQKWDAYHMLGRTVMGCLGAFLLFLPFSKKLCTLAAEILLLSVVFSAVSPAFRSVWTGSSSFTVKDLPSFLLSILTFAIPLLLFAISLFLKFRRNSISLSAVDLMSGSEFEQFCADVLRKNGFHNVELMGGSGDQGVDIVAKKEKKRYAVQCKCYTSKLGNTPVQEVFAGKAYYECDAAAVMTNSYFTAGAIALSQSTEVLLWDRDWISDRLAASGKRKIARFFYFILANLLFAAALLFLVVAFIAFLQNNIPAAILSLFTAFSSSICAYLIHKKKPSKSEEESSEDCDDRTDFSAEREIGSEFEGSAAAAPDEERVLEEEDEEPGSESLKSTKALLEETEAEKLREARNRLEVEREKENQEKYLRSIYGEELKWRREQLHGGSDEDRQE